MSDKCNHINHGNTTLFVSSIKTDRVLISKQPSMLLQHYVSMVAMIEPATMNHYHSLENQSPSMKKDKYLLINN